MFDSLRRQNIWTKVYAKLFSLVNCKDGLCNNVHRSCICRYRYQSFLDCNECKSLIFRILIGLDKAMETTYIEK